MVPVSARNPWFQPSIPRRKNGGLRIPRGSLTNMGTGHQCQKTPWQTHFLRPLSEVITVTTTFNNDRRGAHLVSNNLLTCSTFNFRGATTNITYEIMPFGKEGSWFHGRKKAIMVLFFGNELNLVLKEINMLHPKSMLAASPSGKLYVTIFGNLP